MKIERALDIRHQTALRLTDLLSSAGYYKPTSSDLNASRLKILGSMPTGTPHWVRAYLDGIWQANMDALYQTRFIHGGIVANKFYSTHSNRPDYYGKHGIDPCEYATAGIVSKSGHYWDGDSLHPFFTNS